ncbi:hypothetical protein [uncultured Halopseudomonas sp.]|jgi:hypothetical protein|uniref:hypothetical protein n=1 Tax=uncultured Halopseudomonas sp. TaxID=2901193 RepID=UPI0030EEA7D4|tara:strand:- start:35931 stop:36464 length:534 start_codon:yes stop_codon:yes gene_type:complete
MPLFEIAFQGQVRSGVTQDQARARIGQLFQVGGEQLDVLFSGRRVVIKQGLDQTAAEKYRQAIERAGALCSIDPMDAAPEHSESAPQATQATSDESHSRGTPVEPRDAYMAAFSEVDAPDFGIAPVGADMQDDYDSFTPLPIDLSALSLAPPGADLDQLKPSVDARVPDTDHLKLED